MLKITQVELTPAQKKAWIETRSALLWTCPAFTSILFSMLNPAKGELAAMFTTDIPIAATDGEHLILNPPVVNSSACDNRSARVPAGCSGSLP